MERKSCPRVFGLKSLPAADFYSWGLERPQLPKLFESGEYFLAFAIPSSWRLTVLHLSLQHSKAPARWSHCPQFGKRSEWIPACSREGRHMKPQCAHTDNSLLTYTERGNDAKDCVRSCPHEVTDSSVTNCIYGIS